MPILRARLTLPLSLLAVALLPAAEQSKPHIIAILADDYGYGNASCYGAKGVETPHIDRARQGRAALHKCLRARLGVLAHALRVDDGPLLLAHQHQGRRGARPRSGAPHRDHPTTLASLCKSQGYATSAFGKWHLGWTSAPVTDWSKPLKPGPRELGFDHYFGMAANIPNGPHSFIADSSVVGHIAGHLIVMEGSGQNAKTTGIEKPWEANRVMATLTTRATRWIEANRAAPFFVYFAPNAVHGPIVPNPNFTGNALGKYGDFIRELDWSVGQILATLDRLKLAENTLVIFTSDNGAVAGGADVTVAIQAGLALNGALRGSKHTIGEGGFREPFVVRWPGRLPAATVSDQVICLTDMLATLADVRHTPLAKGQAEDSFSALRAFTEAKPGAPERDHVILQAPENSAYAIRMGDWKLVERVGAPKFTPRETRRAGEEKKDEHSAPKHDELYNLKDDPAEASDVSSGNAARVAEMKAFLNASRDRGFTRTGAN